MYFFKIAVLKFITSCAFENINIGLSLKVNEQILKFKRFGNDILAPIYIFIKKYLF